MQYVPVFLVAGETAAGLEFNDRLQESVTVYIYPTICFDRALFNEAALHCGLHIFNIVILGACLPVPDSD
jgi:hypothetical protein